MRHFNDHIFQKDIIARTKGITYNNYSLEFPV